MIGLASPYTRHRRTHDAASRSAQNPCNVPGRTATGEKTKGYDVKDDIQKTSNATLDATNHSFERVTKATQAIVSEIADYSKRSFETGTKTMENLFGAKSLDKAIEVQSEYAKTAYEGYVTHARRLGELYINLANEAFKPYEGLLRK
jgi:hypothetical protein